MSNQTNDKVSYFFEEVIFEPFRSQLQIPIPRANKELIVDAYLAIQTRLDVAPKHVATISPEAANDVRIYVDEGDVTTYYLKALTELLDPLDQDVLAKQYLTAMSSFIEYADAMGNAYDGLIPSLKKAATKLAATRPVSSLLTRIGNETHGHKGHLHILNFLYGAIPAPEVSLARIFQLYNKDHPGSPLSSVNMGRLTFSSGPSFTIDAPAWQATRPPPRGALAVTLTLQLHDPLEDEVARLRDLLQQLQDEITDALTSIADSLSMGGPIRRAVVQIAATGDKTLLDVQAARRDAQSCEAQVAGQTSTLEHIKAQVDAL